MLIMTINNAGITWQKSWRWYHSVSYNDPTNLVIQAARPMATPSICNRSHSSRTARSCGDQSHTIHGTGIFTYMNGWFLMVNNMVNVGKYTIHSHDKAICLAGHLGRVSHNYHTTILEVPLKMAEPKGEVNLTGVVVKCGWSLKLQTGPPSDPISHDRTYSSAHLCTMM